jgi:hypothetical protein
MGLLKRGRERVLVANLYIRIARDLQKAYLPHERFGTTLDAFSICVVLLVARAEGTPMTASRIARVLDTPRTTVLRKLEFLCEHHMVEKQGSAYTLNTETANHPRVLAAVERTLRDVCDVCAELREICGANRGVTVSQVVGNRATVHNG